MSGWILSVRLSAEEHHVLKSAAEHLELPLPELLAQGAGAYACLCGFWGDPIPVDVRVSPYWDKPPRGPMKHIIEVPFTREALHRVGKACEYVRTVCGDSLVSVQLGEFIVGGTLRALRQWRAFRSKLVGVALPCFDEPIVFPKRPIPAPASYRPLHVLEVTR